MSELTRQLGPNAAKAALRSAFKIKRPVFIWGPPGVGKSDMVHQLGEEFNAHVIDVRLTYWEPTDLKGIPFFNPEIKKMEWAPPMELPDEAMASRYPNIILFLDEMNSADPSVLKAAYQLILNRRIGTYTLPDNVLIVAAGNRDGDRGITYKMPAPLANRFIHIEMKVDWDDYFQWATTNNIHTDVLGYLSNNKQDLYNFDPKANVKAFATCRSWSFVSEVLSTSDPDSIDNLVAGCIGEGVATKFASYCKLTSKLPKPLDILTGKVSKLKQKEISIHYSMIISLCYELKDQHDKHISDGVVDDVWHSYVNNLFKFMMSNFEPELIIVGVKLLLVHYSLPIQSSKIEVFDEFVEKCGKYVAIIHNITV